MEIAEIKIVDDKLLLPKRLLKILKWKYPFYRIPDLNEYSQRIIDFSKENNQLPFYSKFDIDNDGKEEIMLIQKSMIDKIGRLLIISIKNDKFEIEKIKWRPPVNALFFDYSIDAAEPKEYQTFGLIGAQNDNDLDESMKSKKIRIEHKHLITKGYTSRIVYWNGKKYCQEKI